ncbi:hypothetical protein RF679_05820 [Undibacterium cyanobacteriorum]|uniref:Uncharacterized protein n=1 Tax=Undibacterium cyanobacteriorum TaxID=3073561 RepID=A0ABY9RKS3_9BURK|nr:hypothetical protein [Undibacterium sp. 20NA77.5]WMW81797.1 hypothetical protein RF679_05820 [Undibacterium sp. 20NA77.5]
MRNAADARNIDSAQPSLTLVNGFSGRLAIENNAPETELVVGSVFVLSLATIAKIAQQTASVVAKGSSQAGGKK